MRPFSDFFPYILPYAPSAPDPIAEQCVRLAAIEFCQRTRTWRDVQEISVTGDDYEFIAAPSQSQLVELERVWFKSNGETHWTRLTPKPYAEVDQTLKDSTTADTSQPNVYAQIEPDSIFIAPRGTGMLRISTFLKPSPESEYCPDLLFDKFTTAIADGALMHLLMIPEQPYSNPNLAALKAGLFNQACDANFAQSVRGQQRAPARTKASFL